MIKQIVSGYIGILYSLFRVVVLLAICVGVGLLIVYPLMISGFRRSFKKNPRRFVLKTSGILTLIIGFASTIALVLSFQRLFAGIVFAITLSLYGFLAFGLSPDTHRQKTQEP